MGPEDVVVAGVSCLTAAVLLVAGIDKLVAPAKLANALRDALPWFRRLITDTTVRGAAAVEVATAVSLNVTALRVPAAIGAGALGLAFAVAGAGGWLHKSTKACGCLGRFGTHPLGPRNLAAGIALIAVAVIHAQQAQLAFLGSACGTVLGSIVLVMVLNRSIVREFTRPLEAGH
jgi:hypothetical protein